MRLDLYQKVAVEATGKRVAVSACPGSGKTRTIVSRFVHMVRNRIPDAHIALITFTRYAANEMLSRLDQFQRYAYVGTIHAFALRMIMMWGDELGWNPEWLTVLDEEEAAQDEKTVLIDCGLMNREGKWKKLRAYQWHAFKLSVIEGVPLPDGFPGRYLPQCERAWSAFSKRLKAENCITFGMLVLEAIKLFDIPRAADALRTRYQHVLLDEAQDTNKMQWKLIYALEPKTMFVVGDADQSIYEWRGANPKLFVDYCTCPAVERHDLPCSYRFGINIAAPASNLIKHNSNRLERSIQAISNNEGILDVMSGAAYEDVADIITTELRNGRPPHEIAVLARKHATLDHLEGVLKGREGVEYGRIGGRFSIPKSVQYRTIRGYLRLAINPADRRAFMAIAAAENIPEHKLISMRIECVASKSTLFHVYGKKLPQRLDAIQDYLEEHDTLTDYTKACRYIREMSFYHGCQNTQEIVHMMAMQSLQDQLSRTRSKVTLGTIHAFKGLEADCVLVIGANQKDFPAKRSVTEGKIEEERRLAYVAMTRARERLYLVSGESRGVAYEPSQFLMEAGE